MCFLFGFFITTTAIVETVMFIQGKSNEYVIGNLKDETLQLKEKIGGAFRGILFSPFMIIYLITEKKD